MSLLKQAAQSLSVAEHSHYDLSEFRSPIPESLVVGVWVATVGQYHDCYVESSTRPHHCSRGAVVAKAQSHLMTRAYSVEAYRNILCTVAASVVIWKAFHSRYKFLNACCLENSIFIANLPQP